MAHAGRPGRPRPTLWQRVIAWLRPPRTLQFTREGKYFVGITVGIGLAAVNTGNNLLYLVFGMMLSLIIASGVLSEMSLRGLVITRLPPGQVHAGSPYLTGLSLRNGKQRLPSFSIEAEDLVEGRPIGKRCYFLKLPAGRTQRTAYRHQVVRRGLLRLTGVRLSTKFPFGLFRKSRVLDLGEELVIFPELRRTVPPLLARDDRGGEQARPERGRGGDFHGLRSYREGDDLRDIHWRTSARRGRPMVREYDQESARRMTLLLDNGVPGGAACQDAAVLEGLEQAISVTAWLARHYLERGYLLRLLTRGDASSAALSTSPSEVPGWLPPVSVSSSWIVSPRQLSLLFRQLALLPAVDEAARFSLGLGVGMSGRAAGEMVVITRQGASLPAAQLPPCERIVV
jgi:uncharacterized protein (DUF58 family)